MGAPATHVLASVPLSGARDAYLNGVADFCEDTGARLSIVLPLIDEPLGCGCCGANNGHWQTLMTTRAEEELADVVRRLGDRRCAPVQAAVKGGPDEPEVVALVSAAWNCDGVLLPAPARRRPFGGSRRSLTPAIAERAGVPVIELPSR